MSPCHVYVIIVHLAAQIFRLLRSLFPLSSLLAAKLSFFLSAFLPFCLPDFLTRRSCFLARVSEACLLDSYIVRLQLFPIVRKPRFSTFTCLEKTETETETKTKTKTKTENRIQSRRIELKISFRGPGPFIAEPKVKEPASISLRIEKSKLIGRLFTPIAFKRFHLVDNRIYCCD